MEAVDAAARAATHSEKRRGMRDAPALLSHLCSPFVNDPTGLTTSCFCVRAMRAHPSGPTTPTRPPLSPYRHRQDRKIMDRRQMRRPRLGVGVRWNALARSYFTATQSCLQYNRFLTATCQRTARAPRHRLRDGALAMTWGVGGRRRDHELGRRRISASRSVPSNAAVLDRSGSPAVSAGKPCLCGRHRPRPPARLGIMCEAVQRSEQRAASDRWFAPCALSFAERAMMIRSKTCRPWLTRRRTRRLHPLGVIVYVCCARCRGDRPARRSLLPSSTSTGRQIRLGMLAEQMRAIRHARPPIPVPRRCGRPRLGVIVAGRRARHALGFGASAQSCLHTTTLAATTRSSPPPHVPHDFVGSILRCSSTSGDSTLTRGLPHQRRRRCAQRALYRDAVLWPGLWAQTKRFLDARGVETSPRMGPRRHLGAQPSWRACLVRL